MPDLAIVRSLGGPRRLITATKVSDFGQELVDQWALSLAAAGCVDSHVEKRLAGAAEIARFLGRPSWLADSDDADRYLSWLRRERSQARSTIRDKALALAQFYGSSGMDVGVEAACGGVLVGGAGVVDARGGLLICTRLRGRAAGCRQGPSEGPVR